MKDVIKRLVSSDQGIMQAMRDMQRMLDEHGYFNIEIKRGNRSLSQNALYWMWIKDITKFINDHKGTDFTDDEIHQKMKHDFLGYDQPKTVGSAQIPAQLKSTSKLTKGEMHHFMFQVDQWAASISLYLPRPEDCQYEQLAKMQVA